jgi:hypothetical protein
VRQPECVSLNVAALRVAATMGDLAMLSFLRVALVLLVAALALRGVPAAADPAADRNDAIEELLHWAMINDQRAAEIEEALQTPDAYVFLVEAGFEGIFPVTITKQQIDSFVGYLQVQNIMHPGTLDQAIPKAARAMDLGEWVVKLIMADRAAILATGGAAVAHEKLRKAAEESRPGIEDHVKALKAEADQLIAEAQQVGGISSWPPAKDSVGGNVFSPVEVGGVTVDYCLSFATDCGMPVADEFCRLQGFSKARGFDWQYMKPTKTLRSGETCDADYCGGFTSITCE